MFNDTQLEPISWEMNVGNQLFNSCVGVGVGGHDATNIDSQVQIQGQISLILSAFSRVFEILIFKIRGNWQKPKKLVISILKNLSFGHPRNSNLNFFWSPTTIHSSSYILRSLNSSVELFLENAIIFLSPYGLTKVLLL